MAKPIPNPTDPTDKYLRDLALAEGWMVQIPDKEDDVDLIHDHIYSKVPYPNDVCSECLRAKAEHYYA